MIENSIRLAIFEIQKRSLNTYAGWLWSLVNPMAQMGLIYFIMTYVFKANIDNIVLWLISSLTTWIVIQSSLLRSCNSLVSRRSLLQNNNMSHGLLVIADIISEILVLVPFYAIAVFIAFVDGVETGNLYLIPLLIVILACFLYGVGLTLATLTSILRDLPHLLGIFLQVAFWLTPIAYAKSTMTGMAGVIVDYNPFTYMILLSQAILWAVH